uniref:Transmembrane protein n=1 Tax=Glossina austeni TaxID=7395 RepID=A0A1A9ULJ9_GLOAU
MENPLQFMLTGDTKKRDKTNKRKLMKNTTVRTHFIIAIVVMMKSAAFFAYTLLLKFSFSSSCFLSYVVFRIFVPIIDLYAVLQNQAYSCEGLELTFETRVEIATLTPLTRNLREKAILFVCPLKVAILGA